MPTLFSGEIMPSSTPVPLEAQSDIAATLKTLAETADNYMRAALEDMADSPHKLTEAIGYSLLGPGKRVRPALAILCCQALGGSAIEALPAGAAIEMIHCFSLIHDDLPAMDNDDLRRGRPTNHKVFGDAMAILAGDALNTFAFELIGRKVSDPALAIKLVIELARATGAEGMIGGQVLDTCHPEEARTNGKAATLADLQRIHRMKTGALINAACRMGALSAGPRCTPQALEQIDAYGHAIGLAFQIVDDILDVTATEEQMGKKTGKDAEIGKLTYPSLIGLEASREHLAKQLQIADDVAKQLGDKAKPLAELAHYLTHRTN
jgi:geranylgeranyl pyrophosphate synthase